MKSLPLDELETWLQYGVPGEVLLYETTSSSSESPIRWADARERAHALFVIAFARMVLKLGLTPTFPRSFGTDWRQALNLQSPLLAVWNYDYFQLSLRVMERDQDDCIVVAGQHRPA